MRLELLPDELLTTTRAVRKRLNFERPVARELIEECLVIAFQAPNGGNMNTWHWIVLDDAKLIREAALIYNKGLDDFIATFDEQGYPGAGAPGAERMAQSVQYLCQNLHRSPALLIPVIAGRTDGAGNGGNAFWQATQWGSILPAVWSFMLALRARGCGSAWTTAHLWREREMAELLAIPYEHFIQAGLFPIAYTLGTDFRPGPRKPVSEVVSWNGFAKQESKV